MICSGDSYHLVRDQVIFRELLFERKGLICRGNDWVTQRSRARTTTGHKGIIAGYINCLMNLEIFRNL